METIIQEIAKKIIKENTATIFSFVPIIQQNQGHKCISVDIILFEMIE